MTVFGVQFYLIGSKGVISADKDDYVDDDDDFWYCFWINRDFFKNSDVERRRTENSGTSKMKYGKINKSEVRCLEV